MPVTYAAQLEHGDAILFALHLRVPVHAEDTEDRVYIHCSLR
jgi:hypothetical protein